MHIETTGNHGHRHLQDILRLLDNSSLSARVREQSTKVFLALAAAEAKIHNMPVEQVHFHEVGAIDSIIDIVGSVIALELLEVVDVVCSPLPATMELLTGLPSKPCHITGETVTPTGAALVKTLSREFGPLPPMVIDRIGYGAGTYDREIPNIARLIFGSSTAGHISARDTMWMLETNIDDMNPEFFPYIMDRCLTAGAVDVYLTPVLMKKGRPGHLLSVLCPEADLNTVAAIILRETSSLGVRYYAVAREKLLREIVSVDTCYGSINIKVGRHPETGAVLNTAPEWEDCQKAALAYNIPVKTVYDAAKAAARQILTPDNN